MVVLDTNVLSELMRHDPDAAVFDWVSRQPRRTMFTTSLNQAEILAGTATLPSGRRQAFFLQRAEQLFSEEFAGRVLAFQPSSAVFYARIVAARRYAGRPTAIIDAWSAAGAWAARASDPTRHTAGFADIEGLQVVNPWLPVQT